VLGLHVAEPVHHPHCASEVTTLWHFINEIIFIVVVDIVVVDVVIH